MITQVLRRWLRRLGSGETGWEARTSFEELIEMMVRADLDDLTG